MNNTARKPTTAIKPERATVKKPDLIIVSATRSTAQSNKFSVQVKNKGLSNSSDAQLFGTNTANNNNAVNAATNIPQLKPSKTKTIYLVFNGSNFNSGDIIKFSADGLNIINESNENNNIENIKYL